MSRTFSVKNFERFQHYKDRAPPWIKLYNEVLDDYEFGRLPDASKAHLLAIWLLASRYENKIPYDAEWVSRRINATSPVDLDILEKAGFILAEQACSNMLADCKQSACPERETETEEETEKRGREDRADNVISLPAKTYVFEGRTIRLTQPDYDRWRQAYWALEHFEGSLQKADDFYTEKPPPDGKWFFPVSRFLENENREAMARRRKRVPDV